MSDNTVPAQDESLQNEVNGTLTQPSSEPEIDYEAMNPTGVLIIKRLRENINAGPFLEPVDELMVPRYYSVIKNPMDLQTISENMKNGVYGERLATLLVDIRQIFKNCYQFNLKDSAIYQHAERLEQYFERELLPEAVPEMAAVLPVHQNEPKASPSTTTVEKTIVKKEPVNRDIVPEIDYPCLEIQPTVKSETPSTLSLNESNSCRRILNKISNNESSFWFHAPVR